MNLYLQTIRATIKAFPAVIPHLKGRARWVAFAHGLEYKTYDFFLSTLTRMVTNAYNWNMGGDFIDVMANLISGQLTQAYQQAWDEQGDGTELPDYLASSRDDMILNEYDYVDGYFRDIMTARLDQTPIDPLIARASIWANRWNEAYNAALHLIAVDNQDNEDWILGETETHCPSCSALNGIVVRASDWEDLGVHPQGAPNDSLDCGGWNCDCRREATDKRRTRNGYDKIAGIVGRG